MPIRTANVAIPSAQRYLSRLAKHFEHPVAVERSEGEATIRFPDGVCSLTASDEVLVMRLTSDSVEALDRYEQVVTKHLEQVASTEQVDVAWTEGTPG